MLAVGLRHPGNSSRSCRSPAVQALGRSQEVGAPAPGPAQRLRPAPARDAARGRPTAGPRARPSPGTPPAGCTAGTRAARPRTTPRSVDASLPSTPGTQPGDRLDHHERGGLAAGEHVVADRRARRRRGGRRPAGRRPRSGRTAARTRRPSASSRATAWSKRRPPARAGTAAGAASTASTAANSGSGIITMPAPPPNGRVVDAAVTVGRVRRAGRAGARRAAPAPGAPEQRRARAGPSRYSGKIVKTSMRTVRPLSGSRRAARRAGRPRPHRPCAARPRTRSGRASRRPARAGRAPGSPRPRAPARAPGPTGRRTSAPMSSCTQSSSPSSVGQRVAVEQRAPQLLRVLAVGRRPRSAMTHPSRCGGAPTSITSATLAGEQHRAGRGALRPVAGERPRSPRPARRAGGRCGRPRGRRRRHRACYSTTSTVGLDALGRGRGPGHLAERLDHPTPLADEATHVGRAGVHEELHLAAALAAARRRPRRAPRRRCG